MRRILGLCSALLFMLSLITPAQAAFVDGFENWTNPLVAKDWNTSLYPTESLYPTVWGGEWNQVYYAGQGISCGGNGTNFKSVYRDIFDVTPGLSYRAKVAAMSNSTNVQGVRDASYVRIWIQFDDARGNVLATYGQTGAEFDLSDKFFNSMGVDGTAPAGTHHARVILQVMGGTGGGTVFTNFNFYRLDPETRIAGPDFIRNTEWLGGSPVQQLWTGFSSGGGPGDYVLRPTSGSAQGVSIGGSSGSYREVWRQFAIAAFRSPGATTNEASVYVTSTATNPSGVKDPAQIEMHMYFFRRSGSLLDIMSVNGAQFGVNSQDPVKMIVKAPTPNGAEVVRVTLRVLGGARGGAVFDDFSLTTM